MDLLDDDGLLQIGKGRTDPAALVHSMRAERRPVPDANRALRAWMEESAAPEPAAAPGPAAGGQCHLCKARPARYTCRQCGRGSCAEHHWVMFGLCQRCAREDRIKRWHDGARPEPRNWLEDGEDGGEDR